MCSSDPPPPPPPPAPPPPPPPILEQPAPSTASKTPGDEQQARAQGTKKYRTSSLGMTGDTGATTGGLGINT